MITTILGFGRLTWAAEERRSDRYGSVFLMPDGDSIEPPEDVITLDDVPTGQYGRLVAEVVETRQSTHIGDFFRGLRPSTPNVGERIELGEGTLFSDETAWGTAVGLEPDEYRASDWLDSVQLYRAHEQTVRLIFESDDMRGRCELCGEPYNAADPRPSVADIGEFVRGDDEHVTAHAECGLNAGLELA